MEDAWSHDPRLGGIGKVHETGLGRSKEAGFGNPSKVTLTTLSFLQKVTLYDVIFTPTRDGEAL